MLYKLSSSWLHDFLLSGNTKYVGAVIFLQMMVSNDFLKSESESEGYLRGRWSPLLSKLLLQMLQLKGGFD
jgi:hypothetical protein